MTETGVLTPGERYRDGVGAGRWQDDPAQHAALDELDRLHAALIARAEAAEGWVGRLKSLFGDASAPPGLYLWGEVGRGKTFLMDLFAASLPHGLALRRHFHDFMGDVHAELRRLGERQDPLIDVAADIARRCRVLCLDEFLVEDIADAMILAGLLQALFARGVVLVTTSNTAPANLYRDGLQRARFLPAIALIEQRCHVQQLVSPHDWRLRALQQAPIYQTPLGAAAEHALARIFADYAQGEIVEGGNIEVEGRPIAVRRRAGNIAWFDFDALCDGPRAVADYIALAQRYPAVMISGVPQFTPDSDDPAKRFVRLVDAFYDRRVKLVLSAATSAVDLYDGQRLRAEFARTASRLIEMQSRDYLDAPHAAR